MPISELLSEVATLMLLGMAIVFSFLSLLMNAMGPNVAGVIGSAIAAGVLSAVVGG